MTRTKPFKILSLDGGGSWSILQLMTLQELFARKYPDKKDINGHDVLKEFDLVIANSGGSFVLAALTMGWPLSKSFDFFNDPKKRKQIFSKLGFWEKYFPNNILSLFPSLHIGPRYSAHRKYLGLEKNFSDIKEIHMHELPKYVGKEALQLVVCCFDYLNNRAVLFRSNKKSKASPEVLLNNADYYDVSLIGAIHGSSNAPVNYFDKPAFVKEVRKKRNHHLWDGALSGFNNPVAVGLTEAIVNGVPPENISVLSIGTGSKITLPSSKIELLKDLASVSLKRKINPFKGLKFFQEVVMNVSKTILYEPPDWANYNALAMIFGGKTNEADLTRFIRLSPLIFNKNKKDKELNILVGLLSRLDMDIIDQKDMELVLEAFKRWIKGELWNQPIQGGLDSDGNFDFVLGHKTFDLALQDWLKA